MVRNLGDRVIDALKAQAKANQRSLEAEVRYMLGQEVNHRLRVAVFRERTAELARETVDVPVFHTHIVVDWSARSTPSSERESRDAIWWAVARSNGCATPEPAPVKKPWTISLHLSTANSTQTDAYLWASTSPSAIPPASHSV